MIRLGNFPTTITGHIIWIFAWSTSVKIGLDRSMHDYVEDIMGASPIYDPAHGTTNWTFTHLRNVVVKDRWTGMDLQGNGSSELFFKLFRNIMYYSQSDNPIIYNNAIYYDVMYCADRISYKTKFKFWEQTRTRIGHTAHSTI